MKLIGFLLAAVIWLNTQEELSKAEKMTNQRMITASCAEEEHQSETQGVVETEGLPETESERMSEAEKESESERMSEAEKESESECLDETERETEAKMQICVENIWPAYEDGYKVYDGSSYVELEADVTGIREGIKLELWGVAEQADAGTWKVDVQADIQMEYDNMQEAPDCELIIEDKELTVTILPKPLTITISDGVKYYYEELDLEKVEFLNENGPIQVSGFVDDQVPEGFVMPELEWNREVIQKESPMYRNGERIEYRGAVVIKTDENGKPTGNATKNYCFAADKESGYYETGSIFLKEPLPGAKDYRIEAEPADALFLDERGILWARSGIILEMIPEKENGFNRGIETQILSGSGTAALRMILLDKYGQIAAESEPQYIYYQTDDEAPLAEIGVQGETLRDGEIIYKKDPVTCGVLNLRDNGSGIRSVQICAVRQEEKLQLSPEELYCTQPQLWQPGIQIHLSEEGKYTLMVRLEDRVGNVRFEKSGQIVLDFTAPELEIQGIRPGSANNDVVAPLVFCQDEYYQEGSLNVGLNGSMVGEKSFAQTRMEYAYGEQVQIMDIPREKRWDDLYVLHAAAADLAGNVSEKKMAFSVNRFGSVYRLDEKTAHSLAAYYLKEPIEVVIWEFNVDNVLAEKIRVGHEAQVKQLASGTQYRVSQKRSASGWKEYCYRISAGNFQEEGVYYVILATADRAENVTDNQTQKVKMEFAVDRTEPVVVISGVEDGGKYEGTKRVAVVACRDNQRLEEVEVYLNGELVAKNREEQQNIEIMEQEKWQTLEVRAEDGAGNMSVQGPIRFYIGKESRQVKKETEQSEKEVKIYEETAVLEIKEKEISTSPGERKNGLEIVIFLVISGILGGYLYKIKGAKE